MGGKREEGRKKEGRQGVSAEKGKRRKAGERGRDVEGRG